MPRVLLPLFPLQVVLFPRTLLPLHIFEERYKEMIGEAIREKSEFGVLLAKDESLASIGCTATVGEVLQAYPDGRMDVMTRGQRRFELLSLNEEKEYLRGEVEFFDDDESEPDPEERRSAVELFDSIRGLGDNPLIGDFQEDDPQLSFQIAQIVPDLEMRQAILTLRSEADRIKRLASYLVQLATVKRYTTQVNRVAPRNGRGRRLNLP